MKFLQTLNLTGHYDFDPLPDCIWHITTLRHIHLPSDVYTLGPPPSTDLENLQTLVGIKTRDSWIATTVPNLPNLHSLSIEITDGCSLEGIVAFLSTLKKLEDPTIKGKYITIEVVVMRRFPFYQHLMFRGYNGTLFCDDRQMAMAFEIVMFPTHITRLSFWHCELRQDDLVVLEKLHGLKWLELVDAFPNKIMKSSAGGFPGLLELYITHMKELEKWEIEECHANAQRALYTKLSYAPGTSWATALHHPQQFQLDRSSRRVWLRQGK